MMVVGSRRIGFGILLGALVSVLVSCAQTSSLDRPFDSTPRSTVAYEPPAPIIQCAAVGKTEPICGFQNPEDLAPLPGNRELLVSEYGDFADPKPGAIALLEIDSRERQVVFEGGVGGVRAESGWGDPDCPGPPGRPFSPHGIDLVEREGGRLELLVVQHGGRESVEFFEVLGAPGSWQVEWRGCVLAPEDASLNEVVGLSDGSFLTTKMTSLSIASSFDFSEPEGDTGRAFEWTPAVGFRALPGTSGRMPNGIEISADGSTLFMNVSFDSEIRKIDVETGELLGRAAIATPDNVTWSPDGKTLLVASAEPNDERDFSVCQDLDRGACPVAFKIVEVDPESMATSVLFDSAGSPMGAGTVGLRVGDDLFIGSFAGDRILRVDLR